MDMSTQHSFSESSFVFDPQSNYPFELSSTPKRESQQLDLSPYQLQHQQDSTTSTNLNLSQLRHLHEAEENTYLSCSNSPSPSIKGGLHTSSISNEQNSVGAVDFLNSNSLGLLGSLSPTSSSQPYSSSHESSLMRPAMLHRQHSISNMSDHSNASSSYYERNSVGSQSQLDPTSPTRSSFTPSQSPMGLTHSLSSISGLAIGTPQHQVYDLNGDGQRGSPFQARNHEHLLSLSGPSPLQTMAPPSSKRRATGVAHTLYTNQLRQLGREEDSFDDSTPMPPSTQIFDGQQSHDVSNMAHTQSSTGTPVTPSRHSISGMTAAYQTPQSSIYGTPDESNRSSVSSQLSSARLRRMDSYDSAYNSFLSSPASSEVGPSQGNNNSNNNNNYPFQGRTLEEAITEQESKYTGYNTRSSSDRNSSNLDHITSSAMSRVSSAPEPSLISADGSEMSSQYSVPGNPLRGPTFMQQQQQQQLQQHQRKPSLPMTPNCPSNHPHQTYDMSLSAPQMISNRNLQQSPMGGSNGVISPMSLMEHNNHSDSSMNVESSGMIRSPSSGVSRTLTPRSRIRANIPPPLIVSSADKLHVCYCGKRFKRLEHLKRHNRVHTQERPHPCPAPGCNKWFGRTDNLTQHLKTHYRTIGRSSENLLSITNSKVLQVSSLNQDLNNSNGGRQSGEARDDPHAAAAAAAAQAVNKTNAKAARNGSNFSSSNHHHHNNNEVLGGPISLSRPNSISPHHSEENRRQYSQSPSNNEGDHLESSNSLIDNAPRGW